jgi:hypothetical protein
VRVVIPHNTGLGHDHGRDNYAGGSHDARNFAHESSGVAHVLDNVLGDHAIEEVIGIRNCLFIEI